MRAYQTISLEQRGRVARLTLTYGGGEPRIGPQLLGELADACESIADNRDVYSVVVAAAAAVFGSGWSADALSAEATDLSHAFDCLAELPQPVVAALHGEASSAALELALACDVRIAGEGATFSLPETAFGLIPLAGGAARLGRAVGRASAIDLVLSGRAIDAAEALRMGLVSRVVPHSDLNDAALALAERIAERGPIATRYAKEAVNRGTGMTLEQALRFETDLTVLLQTTYDRAEGVRAFLEKRRPKFENR